MRESKMYGCDGGSLLIGTTTARSAFPNCYGDGTHKVIVTDRENWKTPKLFRGVVQGSSIKVFNYDCLNDEECTDEENVLFTLSGKYGVYAVEHSGDMILVKWN